MITINEHYSKLQSSYLFSRIANMVSKAQQKDSGLPIIKLGIGDVTKALTPAVVQAFHKGVEEMSSDDSFRGYGPEQGYEFLRLSIAKHEFQDRGIDITADEIIISDGSKCDVGNFQELFSVNTRIAIPDPVYPVYVDTNVMAGRTGAYVNGRYEGLVYLESTEENGFVPPPPTTAIDLIYLCFPNNPTGSVATSHQLSQYVRYARDNNALLLFDAAYCQYIHSDELPRSIFEIDGARECAVEFRSFSKTAGFTGTRCAYVVIPKECRAFTNEGEVVLVRDLWIRRHTTKFNGVSYPVQKAAAAIYSLEGKKEIQERVAYYMENARIIRTALQKLGFVVYGGIHAPYLWVKSPMPSWDFFQFLLEKAAVVTTPGAGFGSCGEGFIRISAFNFREKVEEAMERLSTVLSSSL